MEDDIPCGLTSSVTTREITTMFRTIADWTHCLFAAIYYDGASHSTGYYYHDMEFTYWNALGFAFTESSDGMGLCIIYYHDEEHSDAALTTIRNHAADSSNLFGCYALGRNSAFPTQTPSLVPTITSTLQTYECTCSIIVHQTEKKHVDPRSEYWSYDQTG